MDTYKLKFTKLQNRIFRLLCIKAGASLNQREIAKLLKVSPTAVNKALKALEKTELITVKKIKTMNLKAVKLNRDNPRAIKLKRIENLSQIYEAKLDEYLEERVPGCTIILFGSYSLGEDTAESDIDIAVIGSSDKKVNTMQFESLLQRKIYLHCYKDFKSIHKNLKVNIINGITLGGAVEI
ncbi:nucleotidyltransferase domain-containing protein [Candidatus Woesearchaeota archaeon]|nr:nucleotidyltransferase domain-containing protein [Candidatus Woesearchaeota archaeon]